MPVRHFDEIGKLYSEGVKPKTDETLISEQKVGDLPADAFPQSNKGAKTDKAFNDAGPEAAENFEVSPNDTNKKKSKKSAYNEEGLSQPVVQEKSNFKRIKDKVTGEHEGGKKDKKLLKGSNKPGKGESKVKEGWKGAAAGTVAGGALGSVVPVAGTAIGGTLGGVAGHYAGEVAGNRAVRKGTLGAIAGGALGAGAGLATGGPIGMVKGGVAGAGIGGAVGGTYGAVTKDPEATVKSSAKPGKSRKKGKLARKMESSEINNSTMRENNNKSTFDRLFEDVMGEDFEEFGADADGMADIEVGGDEGGEDLDDTVTLELPRDLAEGLHAVLMDQLGGGEDDIEDLGDAEDLGDLEDEGDLDEEGHHESHAKLDTVADATGKLGGKNNKVALSTDGGSAHHGAGGQEDGGKPKPAHDGVAGLQATNNKVGNVQGGNAFSK